MDARSHPDKKKNKATPYLPKLKKLENTLDEFL
jgi:hypothetical protein